MGLGGGPRNTAAPAETVSAETAAFPDPAGLSRLSSCPEQMRRGRLLQML